MISIKGRKLAMKKYIVKDRGIEWSYENREKADKKADDLNTEVIERTVWRYYVPYYTSGTANYREITGESLPDEIEKRFDQIIKDYDLSGVAGLKLKHVKLQKENGYASLTIDFIPLGKLGAELPEETKVIKIEWVTDDEFQGEYTFTLNK